MFCDPRRSVQTPATAKDPRLTVDDATASGTGDSQQVNIRIGGGAGQPAMANLQQLSHVRQESVQLAPPPAAPPSPSIQRRPDAESPWRRDLAEALASRRKKAYLAAPKRACVQSATSSARGTLHVGTVPLSPARIRGVWKRGSNVPPLHRGPRTERHRRKQAGLERQAAPRPARRQDSPSFPSAGGRHRAHGDIPGSLGLPGSPGVGNPYWLQTSLSVCACRVQYAELVLIHMSGVTQLPIRCHLEHIG
ncbi:hypothetical protein VTN02DRAFT_4705 [Thermoascus thermophilus]